MAEVTRQEVLDRLCALNPSTSRDKLTIYADALLLYREATANIAKNGAITAHPRTGSPLENPYLKVRTAAAATLSKFRLRTDGLWE
jgi:phage terminase small subunit